MKGNERLHAAMDRLPTDVTAVVPKMWCDVAARIMETPYLELMNQPALATHTIVRAARQVGADGARLLLFPFRRIVKQSETYHHVDPDGKVWGGIDLKGGWGTCLSEEVQLDVSDPVRIAHHQFWHGNRHPIVDADDVARIAIPSADYYEGLYGGIVEDARTLAGEELGLIGDCNSGTLAFHIAMRGMDQALMDLLEDSDLTHAIMAKGIAASLERARFFLSHGIRILRYNDSAGNMSVISPSLFREYILPNLRTFCTEVHRMAPHAKVYCHICGNIEPVAVDLAGCGLDCIAPLDALGGVSVARIRELVGEEILLMGGVNTMSFLNRTPLEIAREARQCMEAGGRHFILGSGCILPRETRLANLDAVIRTAHDLPIVGMGA